MAFSKKTAIGFLRRANEQNRLAHAYLISGPTGSGKREVAAELASAVNGTDVADVFSSSAREIFLAEPESKSRRILIEQIRELEHGLQMRGSEGRRKVAIIAEADRLQPQAANAFLKTLEEPPANSLLLLLSALPEALPDTIVSRCIAIPLAANGRETEVPERKELVALLRSAAREKNWGTQQAYRVAQGVQSLLGRIRKQITTEAAEAFKDEETRYRTTTDGVWLEDREEYYKALTESLYIQRRATLIEILLEFWADVLRALTQVARRDLPSVRKETAALAERFTGSEVLRRIQRLEELRDNLGRNIQETLAFEVAFLEVFRSPT
jgi:DNA polymerase III subunit delta'